jgi:hypothetical protein
MPERPMPCPAPSTAQAARYIVQRGSLHRKEAMIGWAAAHFHAARGGFPLGRSEPVRSHRRLAQLMRAIADLVRELLCAVMPMHSLTLIPTI